MNYMQILKLRTAVAIKKKKKESINLGHHIRNLFLKIWKDLTDITAKTILGFQQCKIQ